MRFLRNYFVIFISAYALLLITKTIFALYLGGYFEHYAFSERLFAILWGYKFDFAVSAIVAFVATLFDFNKRLFVSVATLMLMALFLFQIADILYYYDAARHVGYEILDTFVDAGGLSDTALLQHTFISLNTIAAATVLVVMLYLLLPRLLHVEIWTRYSLFKKLFLILLTIFFVRGMFNHIPLNPWQSNQIGDSKLAAIALNGTYNMLTAVLASRAHLTPVRLPGDSDNNVSSLYQGYTPVQAKLERPNIVFFFLESWSMVNLSAQSTPFLYEIMQKSISVDGMMANGHRTTEGIFAALTSFQNPLGKSVAKNQLQDFEYESIIDLLNHDGYRSSFFQGTARETSGTGSLAQKLGFVESYGKADILERQFAENAWGVYDQDLYRFVTKKLHEGREPFVIGINGASTHDDKVPEGTVTLALSENEKANKMLNALRSSDDALRDFVNHVESQYPNTLFVFFADHCGHVEGSAYENYLIPFALYHKDLASKHEAVILSQRDIAPSVVDLIYGDYRHHLPNSSGKSLFSDRNFFAEYFQNGIIGWIEGNNAIEIDISSGEYRCFKMEGREQKSLTCKPLHVRLYHNALNFHSLSQMLLFVGKTENFSTYK
jgi:phosphoglycerol transferase MdoB-like AlkP superfamily enzyme